MNDRIKTCLHTLPTIVAIHRKIAAHQRGDLNTLWQPSQQRIQITVNRLRCHIASIAKGMDHNGQTRITTSFGRSDHMHNMAMNTAIRQQTHQVCRALRRLDIRNKLTQYRIGEKATVFDRQINLAQIHCNNTARTDIRMTHFRIAHLSFRQSNIRTISDQRIIGTSRHDAIHCRSARQSRCVSNRIGAQTPSIKNTKNDRFGRLHSELAS